MSRRSMREIDAWTRGKRLVGPADIRAIVEAVTIPKWGLTLEQFVEARRAGDRRLLASGIASDCEGLVPFWYPKAAP